jgi:hypothetical protein
MASGELAEINAKWGLPNALTPNAETATTAQLCAV